MRTADRVCQKTSYPVLHEAENAMHKIWRHGWRRGTGKLPCRVYECPKCNHYHLTSRGTR